MKNKKNISKMLALSMLTLVGCGNTVTTSILNTTSQNATSIMTTTQQSTTSQNTSVVTTQQSTPVQTTIGQTSSPQSTSAPSTSEQATITILNKESLQQSWVYGSGDRYVEIATNQDVDILDGLENGTITITSSNKSVVEVVGRYLHPVSTGKSTISVTMGNIKDSVEIEIKMPDSLAPKILLNYDGKAIHVEEGNSFIVPEFLCLDASNNDVTLNATIKSDKDPNAVYNAITKTFVTSVVGTHTLTISVSDKYDPTLVTTRTFTIEVHKKFFSASNGGFRVDYNENGNADTISGVNVSGFEWGDFNLEASTLYYAETEINLSASSNLHGLGHHFKGYTGTYDFILPVMGTGTDVNWGLYGYNSTSNSSSELYYIWKAGYCRVPSLGANWTNAKFATARNGNTIYTFINGTLVNSFVLSPDRANIGSVPGLTSDNASFAKYSNIDFYDGETAKTKLNTLLSENDYGIDGPFQNATSKTGYGATKGTDFVVNDYSETRGMNFDFKSLIHFTGTKIGDGDSKKTLVSPNVYFEGDFTFEWEYKMTSHNDKGWGARMWIEALGKEYFRDGFFEFGARFGSGNQLLCDQESVTNNISDGNSSYVKVDSQYDQPKFANAVWGANKEVLTDEEVASGFHFKMTRTLNSDHSLFTFSAYPVANPSKYYNFRNITVKSKGWNEPIQLRWKNSNIAGEYSNISWKVGEN